MPSTPCRVPWDRPGAQGVPLLYESFQGVPLQNGKTHGLPGVCVWGGCLLRPVTSKRALATRVLASDAAGRSRFSSRVCGVASHLVRVIWSPIISFFP